VEEKWSELLTHPQGPVSSCDQRLRIEIGPGQEPVRRILVHDQEVDLAVWIPELHERVIHGDGPRAALDRAKVGADRVDPQEVVGAILLGPEAVVRQDEERTPTQGTDRGEALDRLGRKARHATLPGPAKGA